MRGSIIVEEVRTNLTTNRTEVAVAVAAITAAGAVVGILLQYWGLVDRALTVTGQGPTAASQASSRLLLVVTGSAAVVLVAAVVVWLASARRRRAERSVLERLGAGPRLTCLPTLVEGLVVGLAGGLLGAVLCLTASRWVASFEQSMMPTDYTITLLPQANSGDTARSITYHIPVDRIAEGLTRLVVISLVTLSFGGALGVATAAFTLRRPSLHGPQPGSRSRPKRMKGASTHHRSG